VDTIAGGQWGNWVIQHIGHPIDHLPTLDITLTYSATYSTDQFASKVIEKALKCCGPETFQSYIVKIDQTQPSRHRGRIKAFPRDDPKKPGTNYCPPCQCGFLLN